MEAARKLSFETEEAFELKKKQYEEEKVNKRKAAARKIAPGFLDTDTRILKPEQTYALDFPVPSEEEESNSTHTSPKMLQPSVNNSYSTSTNDSNKVLATGTSPDKVNFISCSKTICVETNYFLLLVV